MDLREVSSVVTTSAIEAEFCRKTPTPAHIVTVNIVGKYPSSAASVFKFEIEYDNESSHPDLPRSAFAKVYQGTQIHSHGETEITFLKDVAPTLPSLIAPKLFGVLRPRDGLRVVLLEDMTVKYPNATDFTQKRLEGLATELGRFHAALWNSPWLNHRAFDALREVQTRMHFASLKAVQENETFIRPLVSEFVAAYVSELNESELKALALLRDCWGRMFRQRIQSGNLTVIHGDFHLLGNVFYSGVSDEPKAIDWADAKVGLGAHDLAYALLSVVADDRVERDSRLMRAYLDSLNSGGIHGYSWDALKTDYRIALLNNMLQSVSQKSLRWFRKTFDVALAWDAFNLLSI